MLPVLIGVGIAGIIGIAVGGALRTADNIREDVHTHRDKVLAKFDRVREDATYIVNQGLHRVDNFQSFSKDVVSTAIRKVDDLRNDLRITSSQLFSRIDSTMSDLHYHRKEIIDCIDRNANNLRSDLNSSVLNIVNSIQFSVIFILLFVTCLTLCGQQNLNWNSLITLCSYVAVIGILIECVYQFSTINSLNLPIFRSFFLCILFIKFLMIINPFTTSYAIDHRGLSFDDSVETASDDITFVQIIRNILHVCFCFLIAGLAYYLIKSDLISYDEYACKYRLRPINIPLIRYACCGGIFMILIVYLTQFIWFIKTQTFMDYFVNNKSYVESNTNEYYATLVYYLLGINMRPTVYIQILYCSLHICFYLWLIKELTSVQRSSRDRWSSRKQATLCKMSYYIVTDMKLGLCLCELLLCNVKPRLVEHSTDKISYVESNTNPFYAVLLHCVLGIDAYGSSYVRISILFVGCMVSSLVTTSN
ncbi:unnamed protein product [Rotaria magnacalcarata]|uniref:Uncharacterized protein n=1 Tax=Rotaria magnacalcarata TaxID=392030 RepID=A0A819C1A0_9BILA|nr:unnamed protein product [Rotaria magnacalcarata]CAF3800456.1 unnamed protein product [Rotaria magnacalcarata]